jgi:hypothetical protein
MVNSDPDALDALIPTLILQPLVENAVRYGVLPREEGGYLWVSIRKEAQTLVVSVEDDGPGLNHGFVNSVGVGLRNSQDRLTALYGSSAQLSAGPRAEGTGFAVVASAWRRLRFCGGVRIPRCRGREPDCRQGRLARVVSLDRLQILESCRACRDNRERTRASGA